MSKVAIVTDSTTNLLSEMMRGLTIEVVPLQVIWGDETYRDGIDINPEQFYTRLAQAKGMPTTSQPSPAAFIKIYEKLLDSGYDILSVHISSKLSGTVDSAIQAKQTFPGANIEIIDSLSASMGLGFSILEAARAAEQGANLTECKTIVDNGLKNSKVFFLVKTLEFLHRGGRIGGGAAFLGTALNLKPILELRDGRVEALERVRTWNKAQDRLLEIMQQQIGSNRPIRIGVLHANSPEDASNLMERARGLFSVNDVRETAILPISPAIGTHTGPGCLGIVFMTGL
jgi:DegV family protein with EDD domain